MGGDLAGLYGGDYEFDPTTSGGSYFPDDPYGGQNYLNSILGGMEGNSGLGGMSNEQMYYDNQTGQMVTLAQAQQLDPSFQGVPQASSPQIPGGNTLQQPGGTQSPGSSILNNLPGALGALGALGLTGASLAALLGHGNQPNAATQTSTSTPTAMSDPRVQQLLGSTGTGQGSALTGNSGLLGAANQAAGNLQGQGGLLQGQMNAIPQLNPQIQQAIQGNALGFSQGNVPTLNNPQAQQYFQNMLQGQNAQVDYNEQNSLSNALDLLRQRGFAGGSEIFREGAPAAALGQVVSQSNAQRATNLGNINAQQLQYATQLPQIGSQLNTQQLGAQQIPFNAQTQALSTQGSIPQNLLASLMNQGQTTTSSAQGASPNLIQTLGQIAPILGAAGGMASGATANGQNPLAGLYSGVSGLFNG